MDQRPFFHRVIMVAAMSCAAGPCLGSTAEDEFAVGAGHYQAGRWQLAAESFQEVSRQFPHHALAGDALFYRGESLAQLGQFREAESLLDLLIQNGQAKTHLRRAMFRRGEAAYLAQDVTAAQKYLNAFSDRYPEDELLAYALAYLGDSYLRTDEPEKAEAAFRSCLEKFPEGAYAASCRRGLVLALTSLARSAVAKEDYGTASAHFHDALEEEASELLAAQCHAGLAVCLAAQGDLPAAQEHLSQLKDKYRKHWDLAPTLFAVAELANAAGARGEAARLFREAAATANSSDLAAKALAGLAWTQLREDDLAGSAETFERLVQKHPDDPRAAEAMLLRAQILEKSGRFDAALATYNRLIDKFTSHATWAQAVFKAARLHDRLDQFQEARALYGRLIDHDPRHEHAAAASYYLGWVCKAMGDPQGALKSWQSIHAQGQGTQFWSEATYLLAEDALANDDKHRAQSLVADLVQTFENDDDDEPDQTALDEQRHELRARSLLLAAQLAMDRDDWEEAREHLLCVADHCASDTLCPLARFWAAEAEYRLQNYEEAGQRFDELASLAAARDAEWVPFVPLRRAQILAHQRAWPEAMQAAEQVVEQHAEFPLVYEAHYVIGRCRAALGEFAAARTAYGQVLNSETGGKTETAAMAQWMIGESYMHQQDYEAAVRAYLRGEILFPYAEWQERSLLQAGKCYELLGKWREAQATYHRLVNRFPQSTLKEHVRTRLDAVARHLARRPN